MSQLDLTRFALALPESLEDHFWLHSGIGRSSAECNIWMVIWSAVIFCVWKKRNNLVFDIDSAQSSDRVQDVNFCVWSIGVLW